MRDDQLPTRECIADCRILVVGDVMLDRYWHGEVVRVSPEAPVPVVHIQREENRLGGAANVALNVKTLGGQATLLSMVGRDDAGFCLRNILANNSIEAVLVEDATMDTIVKLRVIGRNQQMLRIDFEREPDNKLLVRLLEHFEALLGRHDVVLFSDYGKGSLVHISQMISLTREAGKPILIDPKGSNWARYSGASIITPNLSELAQVVGQWTSEDQLHEKANVLRQNLGLQALLVTRSDEGMTLFQAEQVNSVPAQTREVADVTGAGDTVIATLALMVACGLELPLAMTLANRAGGLVVTKFGTASLSYDELHG